MTVADLRKDLAKFEVPANEVELLLANVTGRSAAWLRANDEADVTEKMVAIAREFVLRRAQGEPIPYIIGSAGFHGHVFHVDPSVLVPRPETEHLVDDALQHVRNWGSRLRIADIGTGSGAIACTIAAELPEARVDAVDVSPDALIVALNNAHRLGVELRVQFHLGDLLEPVRRKSFAAIIANLPYVPTADIAAAPNPVSFEPRLALDGGPDGLAHYRRLLPVAKERLDPGGALYLEGAPPIMDALVELVGSEMEEAVLTIGRDYGGRARFVKVTTPI
jgi:release factor glutamine methyltransferase